MTTYPISIDSAGGEYMETVVVVAWAVSPGAAVKAGECLVTVETAKAATEVLAPCDGWLVEIICAVGQEVPVGAVLGLVSDTAAVTDHPSASSSVAAGAPPAVCAASPSSRPPGARVIASPFARRTAAAANLGLEGITGTGPNGRIKARDVLAASRDRRSPDDARAAGAAAGDSDRPPYAGPARRSEAAVPILLLHGFGADRTTWRQVIPPLRALLPGSDLRALDLPAHGQETATAIASLEDIALHLADRLAEAGHEEAHLVGHSLGGATAIALTSIGGLTVRSLTLIAPGGLGPEIRGDFLDGLVSATNPEDLKPWLEMMVGAPDILPAGYARAVARALSAEGRRAALAKLAAKLFAGGTQGFDVIAALQRVNVPTRLIWGLADRIIPPAHAERAPAFAAVHRLDGIGHVPQLEAPLLTARLIAETVRSAG